MEEWAIGMGGGGMEVGSLEGKVPGGARGVGRSESANTSRDYQEHNPRARGVDEGVRQKPEEKQKGALEWGCVRGDRKHL